MSGFEREYEGLLGFVRDCEGLRVSATGLSVPRDVRPAFYERVARVQRALADEVLGSGGARAGEARRGGAAGGVPSSAGSAGKADAGRVGDPSPALVGQSKGSAGVPAAGTAGQSGDGSPALAPSVADLVEVAGKCAGVRSRLCEGAGLARFKLASMLESLMEDPHAEVARPLFSCVLDALQAGWSAQELKSRAAALLVPHATLLWRNAYEAWAYCGVVARLRPVRFHAVFTPDMRRVLTVPTDAVEVGVQPTSPTLRLPEAVFETADGRVFAMKDEAAHELDFYGFKNTRRRDSSSGGNTADLVTHRVLLLWELADVGAAGFVADRDKSRLTPPDLTVEVLGPADMATPAYVSAFVGRINAVRSRRPVQVLALGGGEFPAGMLDDPTVAPVRLTAVGPGNLFDPAVVDGVARALEA